MNETYRELDPPRPPSFKEIEKKSRFYFGFPINRITPMKSSSAIPASMPFS
jgi:hypothetical protein